MKKLSTNEEFLLSDIIYKKLIEFTPELENDFDLLDRIESELLPDFLNQIYN
jgi:hypothetical protein